MENLDQENKSWIKISDLVDFTEALQSIENSTCALRHPDGETPQAINVITIPMGYGSNKTHVFQIPVCAECMDFLRSKNWVVYYCIACNESRWRYKPAAKLRYCKKTICLMDSCPICNPNRKPAVRLI